MLLTIAPIVYFEFEYKCYGSFTVGYQLSKWEETPKIYKKIGWWMGGVKIVNGPLPKTVPYLKSGKSILYSNFVL